MHWKTLIEKLDSEDTITAENVNLNGSGRVYYQIASMSVDFYKVMTKNDSRYFEHVIKYFINFEQS